MVKDFRYSSRSALARRMRTQAAWKVETHIFSATGPTSPTRRSRISSAALLVKVIASTCHGVTSPAAMRWATRCVSTRVLPDPAPAITSSGLPRCSTARRCGPFRFSSSEAGAGRSSSQRGRRRTGAPGPESEPEPEPGPESEPEPAFGCSAASDSSASAIAAWGTTSSANSSPSKAPRPPKWWSGVVTAGPPWEEGRGGLEAWAERPSVAHSDTLGALQRLSLGLQCGRHHHLGLLELLDGLVPRRGHGGAQSAEEVHAAVVLVRRPEEDLLERASHRRPHPRPAGKRRMEGGHAPVEAAARRFLRRRE